ncbi:ABC transporter permease [Natronospora cellulosivora (SeqCode)]
MKMFKAMFIANVKEYCRDKSAIFWFLLFPLIFVFIFGWVFSGNFDMSFNVSFLVHSESEFSNQMIENMEGIESFNIFIAEGDGAEEFKALEQGNRHLLIELPDIRYEDFITGNQIDIAIHYDASNQQISQILLSAIMDIFNEAERHITAMPKIFNIETNSVQAEGMTDFDYILPGILAMALMQLGLFGSIQFLSLREKKIIRGLGVTPLSRGAILGSEVSLRLILGIIQSSIIISIAIMVFNINLVNSIIQVFAVVLLGCLTFISLGYLLITFVNTVEAGEGLIQTVQFPMMFLSGIFFPYEFMPSFIQPVVRVLPLTYLGDALRQVMLGFPGPRSLQTNLIVLFTYLLITSLLSVKFWRWD